MGFKNGEHVLIGQHKKVLKLDMQELDPWACIRWSGLDDIFPGQLNLENNTMLYAKIRGYDLAAGKAGTMLETGEMCEAWDPVAKNAIRKEGASFEKCDDPSTLCPAA